jgi:hypothetical protein
MPRSTHYILTLAALSALACSRKPTDSQGQAQPSAVASAALAARLIPLKDKGILVVFLREVDKVVELVSEEVHCKVEQ